jgi:hypothetical protein
MKLENLEERFRNAVEKKRARNADEGSAEPKLPAKVITQINLPAWSDTSRAAPNAVFRSCLFPALNNQPRLYLKKAKLFSVSGVEVIFTGEQFDQTDLDVYLELLNLAKLSPMDEAVEFYAHAFLKTIGRNTGASDHEWLLSVLTRLCGGLVNMTDHKKRYFGQLLHGGTRNEITGKYEIAINPKFITIFGAGMWSTVGHAQRQALGRNSTAKALHAYYSTHAAPGAHRYDTLAGVAGLTNKKCRDVKARLIKAHEELKAVGFLADYTAQTETIEVKINMKSGQVRHVIRKAQKSR